MTQTVVIIGQLPDPHIDAVAEMIRQLGGQTFAFDRFSRGHLIELGTHNGGVSGHFRMGATQLPFESVDAVWWRWKPIQTSEWTEVFANEVESFVSGEWRVVLRSLPDYLPHARWVNPIDKHFLMQSKPRQLVLAQQVGLRVPDTVFTNDPDSIERLFDRRQRVIYKTIKSFIVPPDEAIFTNEIRRESLHVSPESIHQAPGIFQQLVTKQYELRVTIVGDRLFAVRINSQDDPSTKLDWRHSQLNDMYESVELDPDTCHRLLDFHRRAGLLYGAYDLIVSDDGPPVFLEVNPGGQWLWLEHKTGLPIARTLAELIMS